MIPPPFLLASKDNVLIPGDLVRTVLGIGLVLVALNAMSADKAVLDRYNKTCAICHASGVANAPKTGDSAGWKPRLAKGDDKLLVSIKKGLNAMPPKGMCNDCSDVEYTALIHYMAAGK